MAIADWLEDAADIVEQAGNAAETVGDVVDAVDDIGDLFNGGGGGQPTQQAPPAASPPVIDRRTDGPALIPGMGVPVPGGSPAGPAKFPSASDARDVVIDVGEVGVEFVGDALARLPVASIVSALAGLGAPVARRVIEALGRRLGIGTGRVAPNADPRTANVQNCAHIAKKLQHDHPDLYTAAALWQCGVTAPYMESAEVTSVWWTIALANSDLDLNALSSCSNTCDPPLRHQ